MNAAERLYDILKGIQEPKGFPFNQNRAQVMGLIEGLITNRERYGYMSCPCRLASGNREWDRDIICPCTYRDEDVREYGRCY